MLRRLSNRIDLKMILFAFVIFFGLKLALNAYFDYHQANEMELTFTFAQNIIEDGDLMVGKLKYQAIFEATFGFFILLMSFFIYYARKELQKIRRD